MDIRTLGVEETSTLELLNERDEPLFGEDGKPLTITLYGPGSKTYARAQSERINRITDRIKRKGKNNLNAEQKREEEALFLADVTKAFSPNIQYDALEGRDLYKAVYADISVGFIAEQASAHLGEWANFSKGSKTP